MAQFILKASLIVSLWCLMPNQVTARDVELDALGRALNAGAVQAQALQDDASARFLGLSDRTDDWLVLNRDAVAALGEVVRFSGEVSTKSDALGALIRSRGSELRTEHEGLDAALERYRETGRSLERAASILGDLASDSALDLPSLVRAAARYAQDADRFLAALERLHQRLAVQFKGPDDRMARRAIRFHLYELLDRASRPDQPYGLYTHVLFMEGHSRNQAFFNALRDETPRVDDLSDGQAALINLFAVPVNDRIQARMAGEADANQGGITDPSIYDYAGAGKLLLDVCLSDKIDTPDFCAGRFSRGPFLLTHERWLFGAEAVTAPLFMVDLSAVHEEAFGEFIRAVKEQVMLPDFSSGERLSTLRLRLLTIVLDAAYWLDPIKTSVAEIISYAGKK